MTHCTTPMTYTLPVYWYEIHEFEGFPRNSYTV